MNRYTVHPHRWTRMQDAGLARSESLSALEAERRVHVGAPDTPDLTVLGQYLAAVCADFVAAWAAARERRHTLKALKRVDRRLLADLGMDRGRLREVVDAMVAKQARAVRDNPRPRPPCVVDGSWMRARSVS